MTIDWTKEVEARKDDLLGRFTKTYYINSERDDARATPEAPLTWASCWLKTHVSVW